MELLIENAPLLKWELTEHLLLDISIKIIPIYLHCELFPFPHYNLRAWNFLAIDYHRSWVESESPEIHMLFHSLLLFHLLNKLFGFLPPIHG